MSTIRAYYMHEAGAIGGVPGPNNGLWPGGMTVYVDMDTMEVVQTALIGGTREAAIDATPESHETEPTPLAVEEASVPATLEPVPTVEEPPSPTSEPSTPVEEPAPVPSEVVTVNEPPMSTSDVVQAQDAPVHEES